MEKHLGSVEVGLSLLSGALYDAPAVMNATIGLVTMGVGDECMRLHIQNAADTNINMSV